VAHCLKIRKKSQFKKNSLKFVKIRFCTSLLRKFELWNRRFVLRCRCQCLQTVLSQHFTSARCIVAEAINQVPYPAKSGRPGRISESRNWCNPAYFTSQRALKHGRRQRGLYRLTICLRREFLQSEIFPSKDTWHAFDAGRVRLVVKRAVGVSNNRRASVVTGVADKQIQW